MYQQIKKKLTVKKGMTMAEMLTVIAILAILGGLAFIAVMNYQRSMGQLERDAIAKELFIAAQNHLTAARGEDYLLGGRDLDENFAGTAEQEDGKNTGVYYITYRYNQPISKGAGMYNQMLPFGSIDDTVRKGGNYVIRYQPSIGKVLDVFYFSENDSPKKFNYNAGKTSGADLLNLLDDNKHSDLLSYGVPEKKSDRRKLTDGSILGWYGGEDLEKLGYIINTPEIISIQNDNILKVNVKWDDNSKTKDGVDLKLIMRGKLSGAERILTMTKVTQSSANTGNEIDTGNGTDTGAITTSTTIKNYYIVLDDITDRDLHFSYQFKKHLNTDEDDYIPGEDVELYAVAYCNTKLSNIAESEVAETNTLFANVTDEINEDLQGGVEDLDKATYTIDGKKITITQKDDNIPDTAYISTIRHLENLNKEVSNLDAYDTDDKLNIIAAVQTNNLDWSSFLTNTSGVKEMQVTYSSDVTGGNYNPTSYITTFKPINRDMYNKATKQNLDMFTYDGRKHTIKNIIVDDDGNAGLFSSAYKCTFKNLKLEDFIITSGADKSAGSLVGAMSEGSKVTNVIAVMTKDAAASTTDHPVISGDIAGGLVGSIDGGTVEYSAAAMTVNGTGTAGGLIGTASGGAKVNCCYSAGQTEDGEYYKGHNRYYVRNTSPKATEIYNVTANDSSGIAGGLVGSAGNSEITNSYSTCSASANKAGGFVGTASGKIQDCYCTGLVSGELTVSTDGKKRNNDNAFIDSYIGTASGNLSDNHYYSIINEVPMMSNGKITSIEYKLSGVTQKDSDDIIIDDTYITPFDKGTGTGASSGTEIFKAFTDGTTTAHPYDPFLIEFYSDGSSSNETAKYHLKTVDDLVGNKTSTNKGYFVKDHYGDWPAPEILMVNN